MKDSLNTNAEINNIVEELNNSIRAALRPFISKLIDNKEQLNAVSIILQQLPEFQSLLQENSILKSQIKDLKDRLSNQKVTHTNGDADGDEEHIVKLTVHETNSVNNQTCLEQVYNNADIKRSNSNKTLNYINNDTGIVSADEISIHVNTSENDKAFEPEYNVVTDEDEDCLLYTSPSPRDRG